MPKHIFAAYHNLSATILFGIGSALAAGVSGQVSAEPANRIASDQPPPVAVNQHTDDAVVLVVREGYIGSPVDGQGIRQKQPDNANSMMSMNMQFAKEAAPQESAQFIGGTDDGSSIRRKQPNNEAPAGINSPRDPATGQATSVVQSGHGPGSGTAGELFHIEVDGASGGYVSSPIGSTNDEQSMRRKPPRNKTRKGRHMHKP